MNDLVVQSAPAKLNLALHVTGRRQDGYHLLDSLMVFAEIGDELHARIADADHLTIVGPFGTGLEAGQNNLVLRAVAAFRQRWPDQVQHGLSLILHKNLPVAAGLGGGSADAAAVLRLMRDLATTDISIESLVEVASGLGADVPACLISSPLVARGIGDILSPLPAFPRCHVVMVNPLQPVPTAEVFRRLESRENPPMPPLPEPLSRPAQLGIWLEETRNDLESPAIAMVPRIGELITRVGQTPGCMLARMSGSGATVFGVYGSSAQAHQAAHDMRSAHPECWVAASPLICP